MSDECSGEFFSALFSCGKTAGVFQIAFRWFIIGAFHQCALKIFHCLRCIPPEHQAHVFERFYRVDKSHSRQTGGTGLGLAIVKHAAQVHQAQVELESQPGEGTLVRVVF